MLISFLQRKKELAILSSVGMTKTQRGFMLSIESILCVTWATIILVPYCYLVASLLTKITSFLGLPMEIGFRLSLMLFFFIASNIIFFIATLPVIFTNNKLSVINEIKYE